MRASASFFVLLAGCQVVMVAPDASETADDGGVARDSAIVNPAPLGRVVYTADRRHSPLSREMVEALREVPLRAPEMSDDVFAKVGASATASYSFLHCFASSHVDLDGRDELTPTIEHFLGGDAAGESPFTRASVTAVPGWHAGRALDGDPPPLEQEVDAIFPRFAVVMYGTNDVGIVTTEEYGQNMFDVIDVLLDRGVIPVMTTIMPRDDDPDMDARVAIFNLIVRAIAQGRGVPLVDFHRELMMLPDHGLLESDHLHPSTYVEDGAYRPCVFTADGLSYGYNIRNLITIEAFDRLRRTVLDGEPAPDDDVVRMLGEGSPQSPFVIDSLPFTDVRSTSLSPHRNLSLYSGCDAAQDESGPELYYRLDLAQPTRVRAIVVSRPGVDIDVHLLDERASEAGCIDRDHRELFLDLGAGTYFFALDTFSADGQELSGEYAFLVTTQ